MVDLENYKIHRDTAMREILLYVCEHKDMPDDAHEQDKAKIVKECADVGYLEGIRAIKTMDGCVHFTAIQPFVTQKGLSFIYQDEKVTAHTENSAINHIAEELRDAKIEYKRIQESQQKANDLQRREDRAKDFKMSIISGSIGSAIGGLVVYVVDHRSEIVDFFSRLFQ